MATPLCTIVLEYSCLQDLLLVLIVSTVLYHFKLFCMTSSTIHKATIQRSAGSWNKPQRLFPIDGFTAFSGTVPGKARNSSAGIFVNSAVSVALNPQSLR